MNAIKSLLVLFVMLLSQSVLAADPKYVVIDPSDRYATTFVGISKALSAQELQQLKERVAQRKGAKLLTWAEFSKDRSKLVGAFIVRNDYPEVDVVDGLAKLLARHGDTPFGLTWNGGLAITANDYRHAERTFAAYTRDPKAFRVAERKADPVHPSNHLGPLLAR